MYTIKVTKEQLELVNALADCIHCSEADFMTYVFQSAIQFHNQQVNEKANLKFQEHKPEHQLPAVDFPGSNFHLGPPVGMENEVYSINCAKIKDPVTGTPSVVTGWGVSDEQLEEIKTNRVIYVNIMGNTIQPMMVTVQNPATEVR